MGNSLKSTLILALLLLGGCEPSSPATNVAMDDAIIADSENLDSEDTNIVSTRSYNEACLERHFAPAISIGLPVPPEIRFFCARPWDFEALGVIERKLKAAGVDPVESLVATVPSNKQEELRNATTLAYGQAEQGPDGLKSAWIAYRFIALLHGLHTNEASMVRTAKDMRPQDRAAVREIARDLDWDACVVAAGCRDGEAVRMRDVPSIALSAFRESR